MVWYGMVWYSMVWFGIVWYGMEWYGMVWYTPAHLSGATAAASPPSWPLPSQAESRSPGAGALASRLRDHGPIQRPPTQGRRFGQGQGLARSSVRLARAHREPVGQMVHAAEDNS